MLAGLSFVCLRLRLLSALGLLILTSCISDQPTQEARNQRPNFLVILADDLAYTDLGVFGGEIRTPNLDALARNGRLLSNFYATPTCSPTRAELLTGVDHHLAGLGTMYGQWDPSQRGKVGYEGYLNSDVVTVSELLQGAGYRTLMSGKWHLGTSPETLPASKGFDRSFALLGGGASHFSDRANLTEGRDAQYVEGATEITQLPDDFFSTRFFADKLIAYLNEAGSSPFFAYFAPTAPHWPLQAPDDFIDRYRGMYDKGYEDLRATRIKGAQDAGVLPRGITVAPLHPDVPRWASLSPAQRRTEARTMEIYAAMVENLDHHVGRIISNLRASGKLDQTFIIFLSDNGAEGNNVLNIGNNAEWVGRRFDNSFANMGRRNSYTFYGPGWAEAGTGPFRGFKAFTTDGGIRVPAFVSYPKGISAGLSADFLTVKDIAPTLLRMAGVDERLQRSAAQHPIQGRSMLPMLQARSQAKGAPAEGYGWELFGRRAIRQGDWKLLRLGPPNGSGKWELFNLAADPGETVDLSGREPQRVREMLALWQRYVARNNVISPEQDRGYANPKS